MYDFHTSADETYKAKSSVFSVVTGVIEEVFLILFISVILCTRLNMAENKA